MDRRLALLTAVAGLALAVALGLWMAPDTGDAPAPAPPAPRPAARPPRARPAPPPLPPRPVEDTDAVAVAPAPAVLPPAVAAQVKRGGVYLGTTEAVGVALVERRDALADCWQGFVDRAGAADPRVESRFLVQLTVTPEEDGTGRVETMVPNVPEDAALADCVDAALADAAFAAPPQGGISLAWPVPVRGLPGAPGDP